MEKIFVKMCYSPRHTICQTKLAKEQIGLGTMFGGGGREFWEIFFQVPIFLQLWVKHVKQQDMYCWIFLYLGVSFTKIINIPCVEYYITYKKDSV